MKLRSPDFLSLIQPGRRHSSAQGFTLIELLVVIAIIAILAALSLGALSRVRRQSQVNRTQNFLTLLEACIERYSNDFNDYPLSKGEDGIIGSENLLEALLTEEHDGPYIQKKEIPSFPDSNHNNTKEIGDVWGWPIWYLHRKDFGREGPNRDSFRLMSPGPDAEWDPYNRDSDDVVNWNKSEDLEE